MPVNGGGGGRASRLTPPGTSDLLEAQLRLGGVALLPERGAPQEERRPSDDADADVCWFLLPPAHFGAWCCNSHGTLHGGLCLALFLAACKAHFLRRSGAAGAVTHVSIQYMRPVSTASALAVRSELHENRRDANAAWQHDGGVVHATVELYMQPTPRQKGGKPAEPQQGYFAPLNKGQRMDAALCCCRAFLTIARTPTPAAHHL
ncbi:uncharacterized protein Tco025E_00152 [Trypanosoma conorhini]|uniref:Acyl-CoA thioesterase-like N-terminal HotDog domain-containing protein n=1 Tax=Trypanosoma conorhini TaxID=83891 RepID=A0A3R7P1Z1_9TRYP|nr:uncharacterized protein Tco025E_00152 [Trypanosoma conorhini]RNF27591.1 hypothetical protein Tco025E_00152 [Trypanosoma conorhini]